MKTIKLSRSKKIFIVILCICLTGVGVGIAGFFGGVTYEGVVSTANTRWRVVEYSGTWVYKNLTDSSRVILPFPSDDPNLMYVAHCKGKPHSGDYDVMFIFSNIYPCIFFKILG